MSHSHGASIREYHIRRLPAESEPPWRDLMMSLMEPEHKDRHHWTDFDLNWGEMKIGEYTVSVTNHAYIVNAIDTLSLSQPRMKHRDILVDNYKAAGGDLATLQKIGVSFITNPSAYDCVEQAFAVRLQPFPDTGCCVIDERNSPGWLELVTQNPFLDGQQKMLHEYRSEFNGAIIGKVTVAVREKPNYVDMHVLCMVTHLTRSDPPPDNQEQPLLEYSEEYKRSSPRDRPFFDWNIGRT
ncbi:hypothetical protein F5Y06DRAFT_298071 [Hypoxylon sp. FL0890]|nr:hypothetical protein F5Y06DRAFT_298071 [Hypoxylon sp. FL0890]